MNDNCHDLDLSNSNPIVRRMRSGRLREIQRTRLGGNDRIVLDQFVDEPLRRYAHVLSNSFGTNVHTTDDAHTQDDAYDDSWTLVGVIDLDTGVTIRTGQED